MSKTIAREYLRVSADKTGKMRSPAEQHAENKQAASASGWTLGQPYRENGAVSASRYSRKARPAFDELISDLGAGRFGAQVLVLWESSRGSRRVGEWATLIDRLEDAGVKAYVTTHGRLYDPGNARDRRTLLEDAVDSEYESSKIRDRVTRAMAANAAAGQPHGRVPYGYKREYLLTPAGKRVLRGQFRDPATAPVVARLYEQIGRGVSLRAIAAGLNADHIPAPGGGQWAATRVRDLALNPAYAGLRLHAPGRRSGHDRTRDGTLVPGTWEPIVPPEVFHDTRELLTDPRRRVSRPGRDKHLLSMIAVCGVCGGPLTVRYRRGESQYWCRNSGHVRVEQTGLDTMVETLVVAGLSTAGAYRAVTAQDVSAELQAARDDLAGLRAHHKDMMRLLRERKLSAVAFAEVEPAVLADIEAAEKRVRELGAPPALRRLLGGPEEDIAERWEAAPMAARREVVRLLFDRVAVGRAPTPRHRGDLAERVEITWREG